MSTPDKPGNQVGPDVAGGTDDDNAADRPTLPTEHPELKVGRAMPTIATIGVYEFDGASFIRELDAAGVTQVIDVRQRRGVRGPQYAWANANRLQARLAEARIGYEHHP